MMTVNTQSRCHRRPFTLVEVMIVTALMGMVTLAMLNLYLFPFRVYQNSTANFTMTIQGKIIREKILCGVDGDAGLRAAMMNSVHLSSEHSGQTDRLDYNMDVALPPTLDKTNDDVNCALRYNPGQGLVFQSTPGSGKPVALSNRLKDVGNLNFAFANNVMTTQFDMQYNGYRKTLVIPVLIETYIFNQ